ncbi:MAG: oligosaccharide flippase family protein [Pseudomonadota bacterium]
MGAKAVVVTFLARIIAMLGPFGVSIITARALGPEDRGAYFLIVSYAQIASQIANLGLHSSNTYYGAARPDIAGRLLVNGLVVAGVVAPVVAMAVVAVFGWPGFAGLGGGALGPPALIAVAMAPLFVMFLYVTNLAVTVGRVGLFNGLTILMGVFALGLAALVWTGAGGLGAFLAAALAALALGTIVGVWLMVRGQGLDLGFDWALLRQGVGYALRAYIATLFGFLMTRIGVLVLQAQADLQAVGQFSIAQQVTDALLLLPATVALLLFPNLVRQTDPAERWRAMVRALIVLGGVMALLVAVIAVLTPWAVPLVFGADYAPAIDLILAFLPAVLLMSLITVVSQYLSAGGFPWSQVATWVAVTTLHGGLSLWLVPDYGALGVIVSFTVSVAAMLAALFVLAVRMRP